MSSSAELTGQTALHHLRQQRLETLADWQADGVNPYPYVFNPTHQAADLQTRYADLPTNTETDDVVCLAGRVMSSRNNGMFIDMVDATGKIQVFCHVESLQHTQHHWPKRLDVGDWIGVSGTIRRTPRGELSVRVKELTFLGKALLPLPEKYHGLTDVETRYRQRYLDLIMSPQTRHTLQQRSRLIAGIRQYLAHQGFLEVETPMLHAIAGGAAARPFITHHQALDGEFFLRIAPELHLKRLVVGGFERVFELNRNFRNEGISPKHNPEFTMLELYQAYADYHTMMDLLESMVVTLAEQVLGTTSVNFQGTTLDLSKPWVRRRMLDCITEATDIDFLPLDAEAAHKEAARLGISVPPHASWGQVVEAVFEDKVEPTLIQPTHIIDYPRDISPLSKPHRDNPRLVERFETRIYGWEVANAFSELTDPLDQRNRFEAQLATRQQGDIEAHRMDEDYITALEYGMPPTGGMGIGIDRLVMLLTDSPNIRDVIAFPTLKPVLV